jgi:protein ImuB
MSAHRRARGDDDRGLDCREPPPDLSVQISLDPPADRVDTAAFAAKSMADDLCRSLAATGLVCTCVLIEAESEHGEQLSRVWRHHRAFTPGTVAERVRWQLDGWLASRARCGCPAGPASPGPASPTGACADVETCPNPIGGTTGGLTLLRLVPQEVSRDHGRQGGFWGGTTEADDRAARGLARVQGILGPEAVVTAVLGGGRGPREQVRLVPWGEPRQPSRPGPPPTTPNLGRTPPHKTSKAKAKAKANAKANAKAGSRVRTAGQSPSPTEVPVWPGRLPPPSPALVPLVPSPAEVIDAAGTPVGVTSRSLATRVPARLSVGGRPWEEITAWAGPWTADERWWDPAAHRRLARLQVVVRSGAAHLLVLEGGRWNVEATYD